jgi:hypothetical protein
MKSFVLGLLASSVCLVSCDEKRDLTPVVITQPTPLANPGTNNPLKYDAHTGYEPGGAMYTHFDCPDDLSFPPVPIKFWDKVQVVNGRLPTYDEVKCGMAIHHYRGPENAYVKPYEDITLPKLAYVYSPSTGKQELVIVIQIVRSYTDTVAGYRYLTGGVGGSLLRDFRFLTDEELRRVTG